MIILDSSLLSFKLWSHTDTNINPPYTFSLIRNLDRKVIDIEDKSVTVGHNYYTGNMPKLDNEGEYTLLILDKDDNAVEETLLYYGKINNVKTNINILENSTYIYEK